MAHKMRDQVTAADNHTIVRSTAPEVGGGVVPRVGVALQTDDGPGVVLAGGAAAEREDGVDAGVATEVAVVGAPGLAPSAASGTDAVPATTPLQRKWASLLKTTTTKGTPVWCFHDSVWVGGMVLKLFDTTATVKVDGGGRVTKNIEQELLPKHDKGDPGVFQAVRV